MGLKDFGLTRSFKELTRMYREKYLERDTRQQTMHCIG